MILILDIADNVSKETRVASFADDTRASRGMKTSLDPKQLQGVTKTLYPWASEVNMEFNRDKFEYIRYWPNEELGTAFIQEFKYLNEGGIRKEHIIDFVVRLSNDLSFSKHIE